jgi:Mrp family chromosome partitioning ATPase
MFDIVREELNLNLSNNELHQMIKIEMDYETGIINLSVITNDASLSKLIADTFIDCLKHQAERFILGLTLFTIDAPRLSPVPVSPNILLNVLLAAGGGAMSGIVIAVLLNFKGSASNIITELCKITGLFLIGCFPAIRSGSFHTLQRISPDHKKAEEAIKIIRTNILYLLERSRDHKIMITSPSSLEGKTTIAIQTAVSMAKLGKKVLLIDCNFRSPSVYRISKIENLGNKENLDSYQRVNKYMVKTSVSLGIDVITHIMMLRDCSEEGFSFLESRIKALEKEYDVIIVDCPPSEPYADSLMAAGIIKNVVIVADYRGLSVNIIERTMHSYHNINANILGLVVNRTPLGKLFDAGGKFGELNTTYRQNSVQAYNTPALYCGEKGF